MKKICVLLMFCLCLTACGTKNDDKSTTQESSAKIEEVESTTSELTSTENDDIIEDDSMEVLGYNENMTWDDAYDMYIKIAKENAKNVESPQNIDLSKFEVSYKDKSYEIDNGVIDFDMLYNSFPDEGEYEPGRKFLQMIQKEGENVLQYITSTRDENGDVYLKTYFMCEEIEDTYHVSLVARASSNIPESVSIAGINILSTEDDIVKIFGEPDNISRVDISGEGIIARYEWNNIKGTESITCEYHIGPAEDKNEPVMKWMESLEIVIPKN